MLIDYTSSKRWTPGCSPAQMCGGPWTAVHLFQVNEGQISGWKTVNKSILQSHSAAALGDVSAVHPQTSVVDERRRRDKGFLTGNKDCGYTVGN